MNPWQLSVILPVIDENILSWKLALARVILVKIRRAILLFVEIGLGYLRRFHVGNIVTTAVYSRWFHCIWRNLWKHCLLVGGLFRQNVKLFIWTDIVDSEGNRDNNIQGREDQSSRVYEWFSMTVNFEDFASCNLLLLRLL